MKILVVGSGGREHALVWKIRQSPKVKEIFCAPGNGGIAQIAKCVDIKADNIPALLKFAQENKIDLTVVGPEVALAAGIVDEFEKAGLKIFGPAKAAARLEGSKVFAKEFMRRHLIATADFQVFTEVRKAIHFLKVIKEENYPLVIKADGLAAGKGVVICNSFIEATQTVEQMIDKKIFNEAGARVIIEECLKGEEVSILAVSDGEDFVLLDSSQDHKRIFDGDEGPNTGGMGAYSPVPSVSTDLLTEIAAKIIAPTIQGMKKEGIPFKGILYAGLMLTEKGPKVLEFNVRFGDPEAQVIIPRLKDDLVELMLSSCEGHLKVKQLIWDPRPAVCVVLSSFGYPGSYETGKEIRGLDLASQEKDSLIFHAGTAKVNGKIMTTGGRVLGVTALGKTLSEAIQSAYRAVSKISFDQHHFRKDIGAKALKTLNVKS